ncbi:MAG: DUF6282 family protein [Polyangiaceae bacterium]
MSSAARDLLEGAIDCHVHAAPSLFPRWGDGHAVARACARAGMGGVVLKYHHGSSVEMAAAVHASTPSVRVLGGVVLNRFVGGLNPDAVDAAVALGAKVVWLPTLHAAFHGQALGVQGGFPFQHSALRRKAGAGIGILGEDGRLAPEVLEIVELLEGRGVVLATGHVGYPEIAALAAHLREAKRDVPLLVNHVRFFAPRLTMEEIAALAGERTWFELCFFTTCAMARAATVDEVAGMLRERPDLPWIVASDAGQAQNPAPPEALGGFVERLVAAGAMEGVVRRGLVDNPREMLGVE